MWKGLTATMTTDGKETSHGRDTADYCHAPSCLTTLVQAERPLLG